MEPLNTRIDRLVKKKIAFVVLSPFSKIPPKGIEFNVNSFPSAEEIENYRTFPDNSNIGIFCGEVNDFWVLDIDSDEGIETIKKMNLPPTLTIKTPKNVGGYHLYFKWDNRIERKIKLSPGIDIITNGYTLAPGSQVNKKEYTIVKNLPIAEFPKHAFQMLFTQESETKSGVKNEISSHWWLEFLGGVPNGNRNDTATKMAGYLFAKSIPKEMILSMLGQWDLQNKPPLGEKELQNIIESVSRYHKNADLVSLDNAIKEPITEIVEYMEPKTIVKGGIHLIVGSRGTGKTFFATQLASSLVGREKFLDLAVSNCKVLFIQKEIPFEVFKSERIKVFDEIYTKNNLIFYKNPYKLKINENFMDIVEKSNCDIFVLDPLKLFWGYSLEEQKKSIDILFDLCNNRGKTGIIVHHYRKAGTGEIEKSNNNLDGVAGLGDWTDLATTVIGLTELYDTQDFSLYMEFKKVRFCDKYDARLLPKYLKLNKETLMFEVTEVTVKNKILSIIATQHPRGIKQSDIVDLSGASPSMVSKTISYLEKEGKVERRGKIITLKEMGG